MLAGEEALVLAGLDHPVDDHAIAVGVATAVLRTSRPIVTRNPRKGETEMNRTTKGAVIALGVAALFSARGAFAGSDDKAAGHDAKKEAKVRCTGVNECKGKGECATGGNSCGGSNECKGKGVVMMGADKCKEKGGTVATN